MDGTLLLPTRIKKSLHGSIVASAFAGCLVAIVGAVVLFGWSLDIHALKSVYGPITMKTNAAIGLMLSGTALWAHARGLRWIGAGCALLTTVLGALTLSQHVFGWSLGIDELLFTEAAGSAATASPNRMGPNASTSLALAGLAILLLFRGTPVAIACAQRFAMTCVLLALLAVAGYLYGATQLYAVARYTGIALHTAIALLVLHAGILVARVDAGPMAVFVARSPAGTLLRRLVVPIVAIPLLLGYLVVLGRSLDLFDRALGNALFAISVVVVLGTIVWQTAKRIAESDAKRRRAERARDDLLVRERLARDAAERASRLKDQFIAMLSHELRTPLNVMLGWTQVLESGAAPERHAHAAGVVARNGRLLARLVEDLLDISRVSAGQFEIAREPMPFNQAVQQSIDSLLPAAVAKGVQIIRELDPRIAVVDADTERIQQIVANLLSNALKFTAAGGFVHVRTAADEERVSLIVADTGIGFAEAFASQLFQPFRQASREHGGLGLGLSIAKHIAELHGGTLTASSPGPGQGAAFTLTLPMAAGGAPAAVSPGAGRTAVQS